MYKLNILLSFAWLMISIFLFFSQQYIEGLLALVMAHLIDIDNKLSL